MNHIEQIQQAFSTYLKQTFSIDDAIAQNCLPYLNIDPQKAAFGDLNSNASLVLAKRLTVAPQTISEQIIKEFSHPSLVKIEIAGIGFLNFFLTTDAWQTCAQELFGLGKKFFKPETPKHKKKYSVEFISANPTGPLHIGNGRGGILGDVIGSLLTFLGHDVTKEYYVNDAGAQIQKLGMSLLIRCQQLLHIEAELPEDAYHGSYLIDIAQKCINEYGKSILEKEESFFQEYATEHTLEMIKQTITQFGITYTNWFSENTLHKSNAIEQAVNTLRQNGYIYEDEGAWWFKSTQFGDDKDRVVRKASGAWTYAAADIAYMKNKIERGHDHLVMILGQDHHSFSLRLSIIHKALGLEKYPLDCILYQLVRIKEGEEHARLSKRAGRILALSDLLDAAGKDVVRFFFLNRKADAHLDFDLELALKKTEENPVYYIQYAYVRIKSILLRASQEDRFNNISASDAQHITEEIIPLLRKIVSLKEMLSTIGTNYHVHLLAHYSVELAHYFHHFYAKHRVIDPENIQQSRGRLFALIIIKNCFELLFDLMGVSKPEKM